MRASVYKMAQRPAEPLASYCKEPWLIVASLALLGPLEMLAKLTPAFGDCGTRSDELLLDIPNSISLIVYNVKFKCFEIVRSHWDK